MAKTITTQYGEFLNYDNLVRIGVVTNWEDGCGRCTCDTLRHLQEKRRVLGETGEVHA